MANRPGKSRRRTQGAHIPCHPIKIYRVPLSDSDAVPSPGAGCYTPTMDVFIFRSECITASSRLPWIAKIMKTCRENLAHGARQMVTFLRLSLMFNQSGDGGLSCLASNTMAFTCCALMIG